MRNRHNLIVTSVCAIASFSFLSVMMVKGYEMRKVCEMKIEAADELILYGDYLGAYEIYVEIYKLTGGWRDVSERAEWALEMHKKQQSKYEPESGVIYKYPGSVPRFIEEENDNEKIYI